MKQMVRNWKALEELGDNPKETIDGLQTEVDRKLDKITITTTYGQAYLKNADGTQGMNNVTPSNVASSIVYRNANGRAQINTPDADNDIANKKYVDDSIKSIYMHFIVLLHGQVSNLTDYARITLTIIDNNPDLYNLDTLYDKFKSIDEMRWIVNGIDYNSEQPLYIYYRELNTNMQIVHAKTTFTDISSITLFKSHFEEISDKVIKLN